MASENSIRLTAKDILEKDFKTAMRGYDKDEIDKFLDFIIKDYELYQKEMGQLKQENQRLHREIERVQEQQKQQPSQVQGGNTNYDILKRLSNLEKHVFGSKLYE